MKLILRFLAVAVLAASSLCAAVPPPEKLLSDDTLFMMTVPDWKSASDHYWKNPQMEFWSDASMKPFKDKFMTKFRAEIKDPLERELGIKFADYSEFAQGQLTFGLMQKKSEGETNATPTWILMIDTKDKSAKLKKTLADLRKKWVDSGKQLKSEKIRDVEFTTVIVMSEDLLKVLDKAFPDPSEGYESLDGPKPKRKNTPFELLVGQSDSLLILGSTVSDIEKVLIRQSGGAAPALADVPDFQANHNSLFRESYSYGWLNISPIVQMFNKPSAKRNKPKDAPDGDKIYEAIGLKGMKTLCMATRDLGDGAGFEMFLSAPAAERKGLLKIFTLEAKDSSPPPFIPADAVKFSRVRLDLNKAWQTIESTITELSPPAATVLKMVLDTAGKDKDPNFDLRKNLFGNLGDDIISYSKSPKGNTYEELDSAPALVLISSQNSEQLSAGLRALSALAPPPMAGKLKEREFLGRKIYALPLGPKPQGPPKGDKGPKPEKGPDRALSFCASAGYLAISADDSILEEYLRNGDKPGKALRDLPGLNEAAQKVGGMNTGMFGYENQNELMRSVWDTVKKDTEGLASILSLLPVASRLGMNGDAKDLKEWCDFSLLPEYDKISKYFGYNVYGYSANNDGLSIKVYTPIPPTLKK